jgi:methanogenic corrinoid protein MtbC1
MNAVNPSQWVEPYMELALSGETNQAVRFILDLLDRGTSESSLITDVLAPAQRQVGDLWQRNLLSVADEHVATGVVESTLYALSFTAPAQREAGSVLVACAEGDWHSIASHMVAEQLRAEGVTVVYLGASTPAAAVAQFVDRHRPDALVVSCSLALYYGGLRTLVDAAHLSGTPVLAGGRALLRTPERAHSIGADGHADNAVDAARVLATWRDFPPATRVEPIGLPALVVELEARAEEFADLAYAALVPRFPPMVSYSLRQLNRTKEDLVYMVRFLASALLVDEQAVFIEFLDWLAGLLEARGVANAAVVAGLEALQPVLQQCDRDAGRLCNIGLAHVSTRA